MVGRQMQMRPDPEVLEDQVVQKIPVDLAVLVALAALGVQWSWVAPMAQKESVGHMVQVTQVVAQREVVLSPPANYYTQWGSQKQQELACLLA